MTRSSNKLFLDLLISLCVNSISIFLLCPPTSLDNFSSDCLPAPPPDPSGLGVGVASIRLSSLPAIPDDFSKMFTTADTILEDLEGEGDNVLITPNTT